MTTRERKKILREKVVEKYERLKYKEAQKYHNGEISKDDLRLRHKFLTRESNLLLARIDQFSANQAKRAYEKLIIKNSGY